ncbi:ATP-binding protein [Streptomyces sp. NPDC056716]|uniref:ATP-binding protein n=1 Tax=unclassified Streptomyces TaxID=2593676 RepID=UPI0036AB0B85
MTTTAVQSTPRTAGTGHPPCTQTFPSEPETAGRARRLVATALETWGLSELADNGRVIVSELVANSVEHTACRYLRVSVTRLAPDRVRIAVLDGNCQEPVPRVASETDEEGRGLLLVAALSDTTGTDLFPRGKRVWSELATGDAE